MDIKVKGLVVFSLFCVLASGFMIFEAQADYPSDSWTITGDPRDNSVSVFWMGDTNYYDLKGAYDEWFTINWTIESDRDNLDLNMKLKSHSLSPTNHWTWENSTHTKRVKTEWTNRSVTDLDSGETWTGSFKYRFTEGYSYNFPEMVEVELGIYNNENSNLDKEEYVSGEDGVLDGYEESIELDTWAWYAETIEYEAIADKCTIGDGSYQELVIASPGADTHSESSAWIKFPGSLPQNWGVHNVEYNFRITEELGTSTYSKYCVSDDNWSETDSNYPGSLFGCEYIISSTTTYDYPRKWYTKDMTDRFLNFKENYPYLSAFSVKMRKYNNDEYDDTYKVASREYEGYEPYITIKYYPASENLVSDPEFTIDDPELLQTHGDVLYDAWGNGLFTYYYEGNPYNSEGATVEFRGHVDNFGADSQFNPIEFWIDDSTDFSDPIKYDAGSKDDNSDFYFQATDFVTGQDYYMKVRFQGNITNESFWYPYGGNGYIGFQINPDGITVENVSYEDGDGEDEGELLPPEISFKGFDLITDSSVDVKSEIYLNNNDSAVYKVQYTENENATHFNELTKSVGSDGVKYLTIPNLDENTRYYVRTQAVTNEFTRSTEWHSFRTKLENYSAPGEDDPDEETEDEDQPDVQTLRSRVSEFLGVSRLAGGMLLSALVIIVVAVGIVAIIGKTGANVSNMGLLLVFCEFPIIGFLIYISWLPVWLPIIFAVISFLWLGNKVSKMGGSGD